MRQSDLVRALIRSRWANHRQLVVATLTHVQCACEEQRNHTVIQEAILARLQWSTARHCVQMQPAALGEDILLRNRLK